MRTIALTAVLFIASFSIVPSRAEPKPTQATATTRSTREYWINRSILAPTTVGKKTFYCTLISFEATPTLVDVLRELNARGFRPAQPDELAIAVSRLSKDFVGKVMAVTDEKTSTFPAIDFSRARTVVRAPLELDTTWQYVAVKVEEERPQSEVSYRNPSPSH